MFSRGYTGHCLSRSSGKHLDQFDLINMNGRIYDPLLGRFLSADKYVQNPFGSQSYNRYSYVVNNPLKYTDPSGWKLQHDIVSILNASRHGGQWSSERGFSFYSSDDDARGANGGGGGIYEDTHLNMHVSFRGFRVRLLARRGLKHQKWQWVPTFRNLLPTISFNITNDLVWVPNSQVWDDGDASNIGYSNSFVDPPKGATGGGDDPSIILGPRGADWGSSLENLGAWAREIDSSEGGLIYGGPSKPATIKEQKAWNYVRTTFQVGMNFNPVFGVGNGISMIITGNDAYEKPVENNITQGVWNIFWGVSGMNGIITPSTLMLDITVPMAIDKTNLP